MEYEFPGKCRFERVFADSQTSGKGRKDAEWITDATVSRAHGVYPAWGDFLTQHSSDRSWSRVVLCIQHASNGQMTSSTDAMGNVVVCYPNYGAMGV